MAAHSARVRQRKAIRGPLPTAPDKSLQAIDCQVISKTYPFTGQKGIFRRPKGLFSAAERRPFGRGKAPACLTGI